LAPPPSGKGKETNSLNPPTSFFWPRRASSSSINAKKGTLPRLLGYKKGPLYLARIPPKGEKKSR